MRYTRGGAHAVTIGNVPSLDRFQVIPNGKSRTAQQKAAIVKAHLVDGAAISDLCDKHRIHPTQFYLWQKQLFENASVAFERKGKSAGKTAQ